MTDETQGTPAAPETAAKTDEETRATLLSKAEAEAKKIVDAAIDKAQQIRSRAELDVKRMEEKADEDARAILANAKVWVQESEEALDTKLFGWVGKTVCKTGNPLGDFLDMILGSSKSCYCCAAVRSGIIFGTLGAIAGGVLGHAL